MLWTVPAPAQCAMIWPLSHVWTAPLAQEDFWCDKHRSGASMCSACLCSSTWLLALMKSADRFPDQVNALEALCSPGFGRSPV